jgi:hypothetical protein
MSLGQGTLAWITPVSAGHPGQGLPPGEGGEGSPAPPIELPPVPPGTVAPPIALPPGEPSYPIVIPDPGPGLPPGTVWPPLNPGDGVQGKALLLCWVPGAHKFKWIVIEVPTMPELPSRPPAPGTPGHLPAPPERQPK